MEDVLEMVEENNFDMQMLMLSKGQTFTDDKGNFGNLKNKPAV